MVDLDEAETLRKLAEDTLRQCVPMEYGGLRFVADVAPALAREIRRLREEARLWRAVIVAGRRQEAAGHAARSAGLDWREHQHAQDALWRAIREAVRSKAEWVAYYDSHPELLQTETEEAKRDA